MNVQRLVPLVICGLILAPSSAGPQAPGDAHGPVLGQVSTPLSDGRSLFSGGQRANEGPGDTLVAVDPRTGTTSFSSLQHPRAWHTATVLPDGTVLIFGGLGISGRVLADPERFDPE